MEKTSIRLKKAGDAIKCWSEIHKMLFVHIMNSIKEGTSLWITISEKKPTRTEAQHRYYFFYLGLIADETGYTKDELHEYYKKLFLPSTEKVIKEKVIIMYQSTKDLSISRFMQYIQEIEVDCGIPAPDTEVNGLSVYIQNGYML